MDIYYITNEIVHDTKIDFRQRNTLEPVHIMQYDNNLPIIAARLFLGGYSYTLPVDAECEVRWGKKDNTFVYKPVLGCNEDRNTVYIEVDQQMTYYYGLHTPIIELKINGKTAGSSYIRVMVDRNPIQVGDIESHSEYPDLDKAVREAEAARDEVIEAIKHIYTKEQLSRLLRIFVNQDASFVGTTEQILALTEDMGVALSTDNRLMYYWDFDHYECSGVYYKQSKIEYGTTEYWNSRTGYKSEKGHILIYSDYTVDEYTGQNIPNIKIADGITYVQDLPFCLSLMERVLTEHVNNSQIHITQQEREFWNNKINCGDAVFGEKLIINRN